MSEFLAGLTAMAALALCLRWRAAAAPLRTPLAALTGFVLVLVALFLTDLVDLAGWEACLLPLLPVLLARHMNALVSQPMRRWQPVAALAGVLLLPYLTLPLAARHMIEAGEVPQISPARLLLGLASVGLFYLALIATTAASGLHIWWALRRHKAQFAQVVAAPTSARLDGVVILSLFLGFVFLGQLAGLLLAGAGFDLFGGVFGDAFAAIVVLGVTWRCCTTLIVADSHCESMQLEVLHEQAIPRPLQHDELAQLHCGAPQARVSPDPLPGNACLHA